MPRAVPIRPLRQTVSLADKNSRRAATAASAATAAAPQIALHFKPAISATREHFPDPVSTTQLYEPHRALYDRVPYIDHNNIKPETPETLPNNPHPPCAYVHKQLTPPSAQRPLSTKALPRRPPGPGFERHDPSPTASSNQTTRISSRRRSHRIITVQYPSDAQVVPSISFLSACSVARHNQTTRVQEPYADTI